MCASSVLASVTSSDKVILRFLAIVATSIVVALKILTPKCVPNYCKNITNKYSYIHIFFCTLISKLFCYDVPISLPYHSISLYKLKD